MSLTSGGNRVQVVQPARATVLKLQAQSTTLLSTLLRLMLLGVLLSEVMAALVEGQIPLLGASVPEIAGAPPGSPAAPGPMGETVPSPAQVPGKAVSSPRFRAWWIACGNTLAGRSSSARISPP